MRVLFLCNKSPYPAREGGPMAMNSLIEGLINEGHQVKVLAVNSKKYNVSESDIPPEYRQQTGIELIDVDLDVKITDAFLNLFSAKSYHVQRFISEDFRKRLHTLLQRQQFDVVQLETLFMVPYVALIRQHSKARIVLRAHNIEHLIWKRLSLQSRNPLKKAYLSHLTRTLRRYELDALNMVDGIAAITRKDAAFFRGRTATPVIDIPFGIHVQPLDGEPETQENDHAVRFFHIGAMNWMPNVEGIRWFVHDVWPDLHRLHPEAVLNLAGRYMPDWLKTGYKAQIVVWGEVDSAEAFVKQHDVAIVPLLSGSGIRIKIIEAMAAGKAVITTETGAEGILYQHDKNILIANNKAEFIFAISRCISQPGFHQRIGKQARKLIEEVHDNAKIVHRLILFYEQLQKQHIVK